MDTSTSVYTWFVYGWGDINVLNNSETGYLNVPILSSIIAIIVQTFFGWRIWTLSKSFVPLLCIGVLAVAQAGAAIAVAYFLATVPLENAREPGLPVAVGVRLGTSVVADAIIAISMTYFLLKGREETIKFNNVLTRLIRLTIETGTVTALFAVMDIVFFLAAHNGLHQVSGVILAKLYSNSLLVIFNNRVFMMSKSFHAHGGIPMHVEFESRSAPSRSSRLVFGTNPHAIDRADSAFSGQTSVGTLDTEPVRGKHVKSSPSSDVYSRGEP
ncbi:hypothetical protein EWM64_g4623 [Hericium alpestre]|uniref:DUF6534 domain-containing protein n=1 Tax=Hericium alpestre TaxID=135208 RepID=A0A4Y9ZZ83_9AGAM|nr:hypothetical protein EWM64_g4623 [Hericium alpestre]